MSGFGGNGIGEAIQNLVSGTQQPAAGDQSSGLLADQPPSTNTGPAPSQTYPGMSPYNTLATDMSRGVMGQSSFPGGQFSYSGYGAMPPYGGGGGGCNMQGMMPPQNPYLQSPGGMNGGYGGRWGGPSMFRR